MDVARPLPISPISLISLLFFDYSSIQVEPFIREPAPLTIATSPEKLKAFGAMVVMEFSCGSFR
jgi:hypothetical protein